MKKILSLLLVVGLVTITATAQNKLPIKSQDALREYALGKVVRGFRDVTANSMIWSQDKPTWIEVRGNGAEDVLNKLFDTELLYSLANSLDKINGRVWLYDGDDNLLFFGSAEYLASVIGKDGPQYNIWVQRIPLLENVQSAEVFALSEDGTTMRRYDVALDQNGHILFDPWMSGAPNGILSVRFKDGTVMTFNLWNPVEDQPDALVEGNPTWKIDGHYVIPPSEKSLVNVTIVEAWTLPTIYLEAKANQSFRLDVLGVVQLDGTTTFERPMFSTYTQVDGPLSGAGPMANNQPTVVQFPVAGIYRVRFDWKHFGKPYALYTGPDGGDGKDVVTPVVGF